MLKNCNNCNQEFNTRFEIDGMKKNCVNRKFCLSCSPYGKHNTKKSLKNKIYPKCLNCGREITDLRGRTGKFCNNSCPEIYANKQYIERWLNGLEDGSRKGGLRFKISTIIRQYIFEKNNNKCQKCGWSIISEYTGKIPLQVDHIDGDWTNNRPENLQLLCPNCHTLTANYGSLNKGKGRPYKLDYYHQNKVTIA